MTLQAILYHPSPAGSPSEPPTLQILDQLLLPHSTTYIPLTSTQDAFQAIKSMRVRGAPAIAIVAALSLAVELSILQSTGRLTPRGDEAARFISEKLDYLLGSRPTAVNLADTVGKLKAVVENKVREGVAGEPSKTPAVDSTAVLGAYITTAERMLEDDIKDNGAIGYHGKEWILKHTTKGRDGKVSVLTHCNTGSLATSGHGTALGIIRTLNSEKLLRRAFFTETRPYNQGSRLTAYELLHDNIPSTLITDSMAASLLSLRGGRDDDNIIAVVVGADRVARNGDTANKIGTYGLAILARHHGKKFLVAAPRTTIDLKTPNGESIVIEERPGDEVTKVKGPRCDDAATVREDGTGETVMISIAAKGVTVWNPAFDVTPAALIDGIITEKGVMEKNSEGNFELSALFV